MLLAQLRRGPIAISSSDIVVVPVRRVTFPSDFLTAKLDNDMTLNIIGESMI